MNKKTTSVLFVCLGNICRSPAAECLLRNLAARRGVNLIVDSCGMGRWHLGHTADERMRDAANLRGLTIDTCAKLFQPEFFQQFDYILVADRDILEALEKHPLAKEGKAKILMMTAFSQDYAEQDIPDPYYDNGFDRVLDMLEESCEGFLNAIEREKEV